MLHPETRRIADLYDRKGHLLVPRDGSLLFGDARAWLGSRASGDTLEVGIGTGRTIRHYPATVRLTGIDPSRVMLDAARAAAREAGRPDADLRVGDAMALAFPDGSFDSVVFCLVLCTVPDDRRALGEAHRVLRPGGRLLAVEHVRSPNPLVRLAERCFEPLARRSADHLLRDPVDHLAATGFEVERLERGALGLVERLVARRR